MKKNKIQPDFFTPHQVAEYLNLSLSTIKKYIYSGRLKSYKTPGGHHRIKKEDLVKLFK